MTIKEIISNLKAQGLTDSEVAYSVCAFLETAGYAVSDTTFLVIQKHCTNWTVA